MLVQASSSSQAPAWQFFLGARDMPIGITTRGARSQLSRTAWVSG